MLISYALLLMRIFSYKSNKDSCQDLATQVWPNLGWAILIGHLATRIWRERYLATGTCLLGGCWNPNRIAYRPIRKEPIVPLF